MIDKLFICVFLGTSTNLFGFNGWCHFVFYFTHLNADFRYFRKKKRPSKTKLKVISTIWDEWITRWNQHLELVYWSVFTLQYIIYGVSISVFQFAFQSFHSSGLKCWWVLFYIWTFCVIKIHLMTTSIFSIRLLWRLTFFPSTMPHYIIIQLRSFSLHHSLIKTSDFKKKIFNNNNKIM